MTANEPTLILFLDREIIFQSDQKWLHPLFSLELFLNSHPVNLSHAVIHDKVVGKAAAMLIVRLGIGQIHGKLMSKLACQFLSQRGVTHTYDELVDRIDCSTETILFEVDDTDVAYTILSERARRP